MEAQLGRAVKGFHSMSMRSGLFLLSCLVPAVLLLGCGPTSPAEPTTGPVAAPVAEPVEEPAEEPVEEAPKVVTPPAQVVVLPTGFAPIQIEVLPLTELTEAAEGRQGAQLNVYVALLDAYREKIKAPGALRFELYEHVQRSAEPKGQRIEIWPDVDLNHPDENQKYWRDFLRAYEFSLGTRASRNRSYVLEVTCMCPSGKRLSTEWVLKPEK